VALTHGNREKKASPPLDAYLGRWVLELGYFAEYVLKMMEKGERWHSLCHLSPRYPLLYASLAPNFGVTVAAVHGSLFSGLERYLRVFAARGADSGIHFPGLIAGAIIATRRTAALLFPGCPAVSTTLGFIGKALISEELLLRSAESETHATICAFEGLVLVTHG
jgi:hypothetical protein